MRVGFVGAGKVGFSLGKFLAAGGVPLSGYFSLHESSAQEAAEFTGSQAFSSVKQLVQASDAVFLTVPDGAIAAVYREICESGVDLSGKQICHCSGSLTAEEAFPDVGNRGAEAYSIHPLFPVSSKTETYHELHRAFFCLEGEGPHLRQWTDLLEGLGARTQIIDGKAKRRYHAACAVSSNLVCALVQESIDLLCTCGFTEETALEALSPLMDANMRHILESGPAAALTGPVERNDTATVAAHLACMPAPEDADLYRRVSLKLLDVARRKHPGADYREMETVLRDIK